MKILRELLFKKKDLNHLFTYRKMRKTKNTSYNYEGIEYVIKSNSYKYLLIYELSPVIAFISAAILNNSFIKYHDYSILICAIVGAGIGIMFAKLGVCLFIKNEKFNILN